MLREPRVKGETIVVTFSPVVGCCIYIGDEVLPNYIGIVISHEKDHQKPISVMECHKGFDQC